MTVSRPKQMQFTFMPAIPRRPSESQRYDSPSYHLFRPSSRDRPIYISSAVDSRRLIMSAPLALPLPSICLSLRFLRMGLLGRDKTNYRGGRGFASAGYQI